MRRLALPVLIAAAVLAGCGDDDDGSEAEASEELTVSAASSLTEAFEAYDESFEGDARYSFAGSDELAAQVRSGAPVDVFASANTSLPDELYRGRPGGRAGRVRSQRAGARSSRRLRDQFARRPGRAPAPTS